MKKLLILFIALSMFAVKAQPVMVVSEIEAKDVTAFESTLNHWMTAVKKVTGTEDARMRVHQVDGSRKLIVTRFYPSMQEMVKGSSVWEFVAEGSTVPKSWEGMSDEERDQLLYRRVQYFSVDLMQGDAFEAWWKKASEADAKIGINYHVAMFKSVFGGNDADYMIILIDKTRFDYYNHWEDRMKTRMASEEFKKMMSENDNSKWSVIKESNWIRLPKMTH